MLAKLTRRSVLRGIGLAGSAAIIAACQPKVVEKIVEKEVTKVVKEVVKETVMVEGTPKVTEKEVTRVVKETVVVEPAAKERVEITWFLQMLGPTATPIYEGLIEEFALARPDIKVNLENITGSDSHAQLQARFAAGTAPDVFLANSGTYAHLAAKGVLLAQNDLMELEPLMHADLFWPTALDMGTIDGEVVAQPYSILPAAMYYNVDLFEEAGAELPAAPWKYSEGWLDRAKANTRGEGVDKKWGWDQCCNNLGEILSNFDAYYFDESGKKSLLLSDRSKEAWGFISDLYHVHKVAPVPGAEENWNGFWSGRCAMERIFPWALQGMVDDATFRWNIAPLPAGVVEASEVWTNVFCMPKPSPHPQEAFALLTFATYRVWKIRNEMPPFKKTLEQWTSTMPDYNLQAFADAMTLPSTWLWRLQKHPSVQEITNLIWSYMNLMLIGEKTAVEALTEADGELTTVLNR